MLSPIIGSTPRPEPYFASAGITAGASTQGSYLLELDAQAPAYWDGWRAGLTLALRRENRFGYYGRGNEAPYSDDSTTPARPYFYEVSRTTRSARLTVQRRVLGPLRLLAGVTLARTDFRGLPGETVFERDLASGAVDPRRVPFADAAWRGGVVIDVRDHEIDPHQGVLLEALHTDARGYTRTTGAAQVYVHPVERLILAARAAIERMGGDPPLAAQLAIESSTAPYPAVGGYRSLRGYRPGRFTGPGKLLAGVEARYALIYAPPYELKLVGFYDAGRVFGAGEAVRLTTRGLHSSGGAEVALRLGRNTLFVLGAGVGSEGWELLVDSRWSY
ncbi:MAG: BamA/TamA family outer membrane protein [Gemmatimonadales bacterium]